MPFTLLHADDHLLVLDKPAGLLSVPGRGEDKQDCLSARVQAVYPDALVVHRLDMATSGLMLMARNAAAQSALSRAFAQRQVHKRYIAVVAGNLAAPEREDGWSLIDLPIRLDWPHRPLRVIDPDQGKPSQTRWRVIGMVPPSPPTPSTSGLAQPDGCVGDERRSPQPRLRPPRAGEGSDSVWLSRQAGEMPTHPRPPPLAGEGWGGGKPLLPTTRLELEPLTGRSHQLRVHLQALGHPILGDTLYAPPEVQALADRLLLHASRLEFAHPAGGAILRFERPAPF